jgi:hypothetical protein
MPMYDFECPAGHITEHFLSGFQEKVECGMEFTPDDNDGERCYCAEEAEYRPSFWYTSQNARRFDPVVIHRDENGNVRFPAHANAPVPEGFYKVELSDFRQIRALEKEINTKDREKAQEFKEARQKFLDGQLRENRRVMENIINGGQEWKDRDGVAHRGFTNRGRAFYDAMRKASEHHQRNVKGANPEFVVEAFSQNASNREDYRDARNDWGKYGRRK